MPNYKFRRLREDIKKYFSMLAKYHVWSTPNLFPPYEENLQRK